MELFKGRVNIWPSRGEASGHHERMCTLNSELAARPASPLLFFPTLPHQLLPARELGRVSGGISSDGRTDSERPEGGRSQAEVRRPRPEGWQYRGKTTWPVLEPLPRNRGVHHPQRKLSRHKVCSVIILFNIFLYTDTSLRIHFGFK